jgi:hypothetical protein
VRVSGVIVDVKTAADTRSISEWRQTAFSGQAITWGTAEAFDYSLKMDLPRTVRVRAAGRLCW